MAAMSVHGFSYWDLLLRNAAVNADLPVVSGAFGIWSHAQLKVRAEALAQQLHAKGVANGDRIAVLASNQPQVLQLLGACSRLGATLVLLNTRAHAQEIGALLEDAEPALVFAEASLVSLLALAPAAVVCHELDTLASMDLTEVSLPATQTLPPPKVNAPLVAIPTAAINGRPRLALLSDSTLLHQALQLAYVWSLGPADRHLCLLPLFHMAGLGLTLAGQLAGGASILMPRFDAEAAAREMAFSRVTYFASFSPILEAILDAAAHGHDLGSLRVVTGLEPPKVVDRLHASWPQAQFWSGYGQTETGGMVSLSPSRDLPGSAGRPLPLVQLRIEAADGRAAAPGQSGDILVRGPCVFSGYWQRLAETVHAARDGWHHTGDRGRIDERGFLWFEGRAPEKALIKSGGENIYPAEVEQALEAHPAVMRAVVVGVPDKRWGEAVRAICELHPGQTVSAEELIDFVGMRIARFKRPREVRFEPRLPRHEDGSLDREAVAQAHRAD